MSTARLTTITLAVVLMIGGCSGRGIDHRQVTDPGVDSLFAHYDVLGSPGAAVMVIRDGRVLHSAGYGLADLGSGAQITPSTPFRLASVSKQFFTMGIMLLAERDSLTYDDPVSTWIPELRRFPGITIRHLMNHTSGLPNYYAQIAEMNPQLDDDPLITNSEAATIYESWGELDFQPGEKYQYSNPAYEILALVMERALGLSAKQFMRENLFAPLSMKTADIRDRRDYKIPNSAVGYSLNDDSTTWVENDDHKLNGLVGAGGVYASLDDLYRWDQSLYEGGVVSRPTLDAAFEPTTLNDGSTSDYGFGWGLGERNGHRYVAHNGAWVGFRTAIVRYPEEALTVIVLTNSTGPAGTLRDSVAARFLAGPRAD